MTISTLLSRCRGACSSGASCSSRRICTMHNMHSMHNASQRSQEFTSRTPHRKEFGRTHGQKCPSRNFGASSGSSVSYAGSLFRRNIDSSGILRRSQNGELIRNSFRSLSWLSGHFSPSPSHSQGSKMILNPCHQTPKQCSIRCSNTCTNFENSISLSTHQFSRSLSSLPHDSDSDSDSDGDSSPQSPKTHNSSHSCHINHPCYHRLLSLRNVGIFAHVDAGKTTVTERMLALSGIVRNAGSVDEGDTVTDYLPAERERGITIQSAAVGFEWIVPAAPASGNIRDANSGEMPRRVEINLIDTPGHVDFSVEVHRSVAVLDGAVLVVDAVAGVQAQTETVWRAIRNTESHYGSSSNSTDGSSFKRKSSSLHGTHGHEPLPAVLFVNKMDRDGADFRHAIETVKRKLSGSCPVPIQLPLYRMSDPTQSGSDPYSTGTLGSDVVAGTLNEPAPHGEFIGILDIVHMRALIYPPDAEDLSMEEAVPTVIPLAGQSCQPMDAAMDARRDLVSALADVDEGMEDLYLDCMENEDDDFDGISTLQLQLALRRATLSKSIMPTLCGAALRGVGVEPVLDAVAELLPCPLDRLAPKLTLLSNSQSSPKTNQKDSEKANSVELGHPLHPSTLAFVFKVLHMKGKGSGDGRVAFARVYSGVLKSRDTVRVISPHATSGNHTNMISNDSSNGDSPSGIDGQGAKTKKTKFPIERIGGMLELSGGRFDNLPEGECLSGDVCALIGLKGVVTGDTLLLTSASSNSTDGGNKKSSKKVKGKNKNNDLHWKQYDSGLHLSTLTSPKPVLTLRVEANSSSEQSRLSQALLLLSVEDPSLVVEETERATLISGLGELHLEIVLDRLRREHGLGVRIGKPAVAYRESISFDQIENGAAETNGMVEYDRTVGGTRLQAAIALRLTPQMANEDLCVPPEEPTISLSSEVKEYFNLDTKASKDVSEHKYPPSLQAILSGLRGSFKRGRLGPYPLANLHCQILQVDSDMTEGSSSDTLPGAMRAAAAHAANSLLERLSSQNQLVILEPKMNIEISVPTTRVGDVLSDLTGRRGVVDDVFMGDDHQTGSASIGSGDHIKAMVRAEVPLVEILGYANGLRSLTGGEGAFSAEYKGHSPKDQ